MNRTGMGRAGAGAVLARCAPLLLCCLLLPPAARARADAHTGAVKGARVRSGAERLLSGAASLPGGGCLGMLTNPTAVLPDLSHVVDRMAQANGTRNISICAVFAPEHGFRGDAQAGHGGPGVSIDTRTGLPVYSLYGKNVSEQTKILRASNISTLVFDIQDVGARFYTFVWSLYDAMHAAMGDTSVRHIVVLDRPNPLGGVHMRGPVLEPDFASFIGRAAVPQQHGMTVGELARFFFHNLQHSVQPQQPPPFRLEVITMDNWSRDMLYDATGLPWVMPSPNMPTPDTAAVYPGLGILEGTNLSEGRGTTRPFELAGAPYLNYTFALALQADAAKYGVGVREAYFVPTFSKWTGNVSAGLQTYVVDGAAFDAVAWGVNVVATAQRLAPGNFSFLGDGDDFDLHMGSNATRLALERGDAVADIVSRWQPGLESFARARQPFLLY